MDPEAADAILHATIDQPVELVYVGMHVAIGKKANEMQGPAMPCSLNNSAPEIGFEDTA
jgi:hypothetical protein